jgi:hypothetical protein
VDRIYAALRSADGWVRCYDGASTKVDYRPEPDRVSHTMRAEGLIRAPLKNVAALLNEPDLFSSLFWFISDAEHHGMTGRFRSAARLQMYAPPPLSDRDVNVFGYAVDALDNDGCVLVVSRDLREGDGYPEAMAEDEKRAVASASLVRRSVVRASVHYSMVEMQPLSPHVTKIKLIANSDPKLAYVPIFLVNWSSRVMMRFALRVIESKARIIETLPHAQRMAENPVYQWIDDRLASYWVSKGYSEADYRTGMEDLDDSASADFKDERPEPPARSSLLALLPSLSVVSKDGDASPSSSLSSLRRMISRDKG